MSIGLEHKSFESKKVVLNNLTDGHGNSSFGALHGNEQLDIGHCE